MRGTITGPDERDQAIISKRRAALDEITGPRVGDYVEFADGVTRRISHIWEAWEDPTGRDSFPAQAQTSDGGSYYLGDGYVSMSGSLYSGVQMDTLTATGETRMAGVWIFHHDHHTAHNGIDVQIPVRVFRCSLPATS